MMYEVSSCKDVACVVITPDVVRNNVDPTLVPREPRTIGKNDGGRREKSA